MATREIRFDAELARRAGINPSTFANAFKQERKRFPFADDAVRLARALDTTVEYLVTGEKPPMERVPFEISELCRMLQGLSKEQLAEIRGVVRTHIDHHFADTRAERASGE